MTNPHDRHQEMLRLEAEFAAACAAGVERCRELTPPYNPKTWIRLMRYPGARRAAEDLVATGDIQSGFRRLFYDYRRPDLTLEVEILRDRWEPLFSQRHREATVWRIDQALDSLNEATRQAVEPLLDTALGRPWADVRAGR